MTLDAPEKRRLDCSSCGHEIVFTPGYSYDAEAIECPKCGKRQAGFAEGVEIAEKYLTLERAIEIGPRYTYDEYMDMARRLYDAPESARPEEIEAVMAFHLLRAAGLPAHAPARGN